MNTLNFVWACFTVVILGVGFQIGTMNGVSKENARWEQTMVQHPCCEFDSKTGDFHIIQTKAKFGLKNRVVAIPSEIDPANDTEITIQLDGWKMTVPLVFKKEVK